MVLLASRVLVGTPRTGRVVVVQETRYRSQPQPAGLIAGLARRAHDATVIDADAGLFDLRQAGIVHAASVVVARGRSQGVLTVLRLAEAWGVRTLNRSTAIAAVLDKAAMAITLARAGVPTPPTFLGPLDALAGGLPRACYPLLLKPVRGDNAEGLRLVGSPAQLRALSWPESPALAQCFLPSDGCDIKLYGIGDWVAAVRKASPLCRADPGTRIPLTDELAQLARRCGRLFGLELYGVDCIGTPDGPVVIEVNDFPNYSAVPEAADRLAEHVLATARRYG